MLLSMSRLYSFYHVISISIRILVASHLSNASSNKSFQTPKFTTCTFKVNLSIADCVTMGQWNFIRTVTSLGPEGAKSFLRGAQSF